MKLKKLTQTRLPNGLILYYAQVDESVSFDIAMHLNTGSRDEKQRNNGVSHFLEHMMFRGSKQFPNSVALGKAMESFGGESNAMTSNETTVYWLRGSARAFNDGMEMFSEFFLNPNFADLELERSVILQELASEYNEDGLCIDCDTLAMEALFGKSALGLPIIGNQKSVKSLCKKDLNEKRGQFYIENESILAICAPFPLQSVLKSASKNFGKDWRHRTAQKLRRELVEEKSFFSQERKDSIVCQENSDNQFSAKILFPAHGGLSRDVVVQNMLQRLLDDGMASRLPALLRERHGLVYDVSCDAANYLDVGTFSIDFTVSVDQLDAVLAKLGDELCSLVHTVPTREEIEHLRFRYLFDLENLAESPQRVLNREVSNAFLPRTLSLKAEMQAVESVSAQDIREKARQLFTAKRRAFVLVGPNAKSRKTKLAKFLEKLAQVRRANG